MNLTRRINPPTKQSPATTAATPICTGDSWTVSSSWSPRFRMPKNADNTVLAIAAGVALRFTLSFTA